jgi:hypothetical protein
MRNAVIIGDLRDIEDEAIILGGNVRIVLPRPSPSLMFRSGRA